MKVAMVVSSVGYRWEEVFGAYKEFVDEGAAVEFYTVDGKPPKPDPSSIKKYRFLSLLGYGTSPAIAPDTPMGGAEPHRG